MQRDRRRDPYPWSWEPAAGALLAVLVLLALATQLGRSVANLCAGAGWTWPSYSNGDGAAFWSSLLPIWRGDASAGLGSGDGRPTADPVLLRTCLGVTLAVLVLSVSALGRWLLARFGPGRIRGTASASELPSRLGAPRMAKSVGVLRPDLVAAHGARRARAMSPQLGWRLGRAHEPRGCDLWVPWDRTTGVIGPQGSGKTLDLLAPALLGAPGPALVTLTKPEDLLLTLTERAAGGRPCVVLDPFGLVDGAPPELLTGLVWDPVAGCEDSAVAERRARAFCAGTISGSVRGGNEDGAARFYAAEAAKVLQCYLHAAALGGRTIDDVLRWVANPPAAVEPEETLRRDPRAEPFWFGLLRGAVRGDERTVANTTATVQQTMTLFFRASVRERCVPRPDRPATDLLGLIAAGGTVYLLGRDDPYVSAAPLMTAVAEDVLDTALALAHSSPWNGRLCPPFLACLDELPSTAPLPTLRTRMANERALGIAFVWAAQTRAQLVALFGEQEARALVGLTNVLAVFGGSKDVAFNREVADLTGRVRVARRSRSVGGRGGGTVSGEDIPVLTAEEVRHLAEGTALVVAENLKPVIARLDRCLSGRAGVRRAAALANLRRKLHQRDATEATEATAP